VPDPDAFPLVAMGIQLHLAAEDMIDMKGIKNG
jgi:hypothetical protein